MNYNYFIQKRILIISLIVAFIVVFTVLLHFLRSPQDDPRQEVAAPLGSSAVERVYIKDFQKTATDPAILRLQKQTENILYNRASEKGKRRDLYTGVLRDNSYKRESLNNVTTTTFLVDISPINITYRVSVTGLNENYSVVVSCAPEELQKTSSAVCEDPEYYL